MARTDDLAKRKQHELEEYEQIGRLAKLRDCRITFTYGVS